MKVLIAEDDPVSRQLLQVTLSKWGYDPIIACDGLEAWKVLQRGDAPTLAILDWMMPGMDGLQICRKVRKLKGRPYTYILLLTAKGRKQDLVEGLEAGADDYITKPFDARELKVRLFAGKRIIALQSELIRMREALSKQATHDALTGLPNRLLFGDQLNRRLAETSQAGQSLAVMFLDLDRFKLINDTLGHNIGDALLKQVAERLSSSLSTADMIARMGGDEFTIILTNLSGPEQAASTAQKILDILSAPFAIDDQELFITGSIGISLYPLDGRDAETLVKSADTAMYQAKAQGRNRYQPYIETLNIMASKQMKLETSLRKALERNELVLYYQPWIGTKSGRIIGAEALVRWQHPELGLLLPAEFIPLSEETKLIMPIGEWILYTACAQNKAWQDAGLPPMEVAVNISACQLEDNSLPQVVKRALAKAGLASQYLCLEVTESMLMRNPDLAAGTLVELKEIGVHVFIDDFGTGHSSLSYLKRFPTNGVKIDQSFIRYLAENPDDAAIAGAIVAMAHIMKLRVVAEGVETIEQLEFLRSLNCDEIQGYFISQPLPPEKLTQVLVDAYHSLSDYVLPAA